MNKMSVHFSALSGKVDTRNSSGSSGQGLTGVRASDTVMDFSAFLSSASAGNPGSASFGKAAQTRADNSFGAVTEGKKTSKTSAAKTGSTVSKEAERSPYAGSANSGRAAEKSADSRETPAVKADGGNTASGQAGLNKNVDEAAAKVRKVIAEELGVSEEEVDAVLESMGFQIADLLNMSNVMEVIQALAGDSIAENSLAAALLTDEGLYKSVGTIQQTVETSIDELARELGIEGEALLQAIEEVKSAQSVSGSAPQKNSGEDDGSAGQEAAAGSVFRNVNQEEGNPGRAGRRAFAAEEPAAVRGDVKTADTGSRPQAAGDAQAALKDTGETAMAREAEVQSGPEIQASDSGYMEGAQVRPGTETDTVIADETTETAGAEDSGVNAGGYEGVQGEGEEKLIPLDQEEADADDAAAFPSGVRTEAEGSDVNKPEVPVEIAEEDGGGTEKTLLPQADGKAVKDPETDADKDRAAQSERAGEEAPEEKAESSVRNTAGTPAETVDPKRGAEPDRQPESAVEDKKAAAQVIEDEAAEDEEAEGDSRERKRFSGREGIDRDTRSGSAKSSSAEHSVFVTGAAALQDKPVDMAQQTISQGMSSRMEAYEQAWRILDQLSSQIRINLNQNTTTLEMQLNPASLGKVGLHIESKAGAITASFVAQNAQVKEALEAQAAQLKSNLEEQGLKVENVEVTLASHEFEQNMMGGNMAQNFANQNSQRRSERMRRILSGRNGVEGDEEGGLDIEGAVYTSGRSSSDNPYLVNEGSTVDFSA